MPSYEAEVRTDRNYQGNVVIRLGGKYFAVREPDSGLTIPYPYSHCIEDLTVNSANINPKTVATSISSTTFKLVDKLGIVSMLVKDDGADLINSEIEIYLGRSGVGMAFSDYRQLPLTRLAKWSKKGGVFTFATRDATERINKPVYKAQVRLDGDIIAATSTISGKTSLEDFPESGWLRIGSEIIEYSSRDDESFFGCARGAFDTVAEDYDDNEEIFQAEVLEGNPVDLLLQLLVSNGGGGDYDVLKDGLGLDPDDLIDVAEIEQIRDDYFADEEFAMCIYNQDSALKFLEAEILTPCKLRFVVKEEKLTLATIDRSNFVDEADVIDHDTLLEAPDAEVDQNDVQNRVEVKWNYNEATGKYENTSVYEDEDSIEQYGASTSPLKFSFKGVQSQTFVDLFAQSLLDRYAFPAPSVKVKTLFDKSLLSLGDKTALETSLLANPFGEAQFNEILEIISRGIAWRDGKVSLTLEPTSFRDYRLGYISPSSAVAAVASQSVFEVPSGEGELWKVGWHVKLWDIAANEYTADSIRTITEIDGDEITVDTAFDTTLDDENHVLVFPTYDEATPGQKRYAFIGIDGEDFSRNEKVYSIVP